MHILRGCLGLGFFILVAWLLSSDRRRLPGRVIAYGLGLQVVLAAFLLATDVGVRMFEGIARFLSRLITMQAGGAKLVFGNLSTPSLGEGGWGFALAFATNGLTVMIFFSALMAVLYHLGIMQLVIFAMAKVMSALMGVSGAESLAMAANVFIGQTEAPLVVKPYLARMTRSELFALMTGGFATIAGSVLALYMGFLGEEVGPHLVTASVLSAPAALLMAKVMLPESESPVTGGRVELRFDRSAGNVIEAAANGTSDGLKLWLNVIAMLIAFMGLVALVDWPLQACGEFLSRNTGFVGTLSLGRIFGWVFAPVAWLMGVDGWHDCLLMGRLLGTKVAVNELIGYQQLAELLPSAQPASGIVLGSVRTAKMAAYALCGFANFASIGIQIGGISPLVPERKPEIAALALKAMVGGACASWMTATVAGMFL